ncbi:hypothetical protein C2E23DRAFT_809213 [Lenzites betulinus]|nr:hypothetical protein C2E23DRAFT_809213 [Lenzites betulinus]
MEVENGERGMLAALALARHGRGRCLWSPRAGGAAAQGCWAVGLLDCRSEWESGSTARQRSPGRALACAVHWPCSKLDMKLGGACDWPWGETEWQPLALGARGVRAIRPGGRTSGEGAFNAIGLRKRKLLLDARQATRPEVARAKHPLIQQMHLAWIARQYTVQADITVDTTGRAGLGHVHGPPRIMHTRTRKSLRAQMSRWARQARYRD